MSYLKQAKMSLFFFLPFTKSENRRVEQILSGGLGTSGKGERVGKYEPEYGANTVYTCM
jgi:hypothetical protein